MPSREQEPALERVGRDEDGDFGQVLGLEHAVQVLGHVHVHVDGAGPLQALHQDQLPGVPVRALHHEVPTVVPARDAEAEAVGSRPAGSHRCGHAEQRRRSLELGGEREVVEGDGFGSLVAQAALHGARVALALAAKGKATGDFRECGIRAPRLAGVGSMDFVPRTYKGEVLT